VARTKTTTAANPGFEDKLWAEAEQPGVAIRQDLEVLGYGE